MSARLTIITYSNPKAFVVPESAIVMRDKQSAMTTIDLINGMRNAITHPLATGGDL